jgi:hypothetical protein
MLLLPTCLAGSGTGKSAAGLENHPMYPCAKLKLDQLFLQWLALPDSQQLVSTVPGRVGS